MQILNAILYMATEMETLLHGSHFDTMSMHWPAQNTVQGIRRCAVALA